MVKPKQLFIDWALSVDPQLMMDEDSEGSVYLIEEEFWDDDLLVEWIGILTNITKDDMPAGLHWHDLLMDNNCKIVQLCQRILESKEPMKRRDDLKLEVIIWLGELCASKECSHWIATRNFTRFFQ